MVALMSLKDVQRVTTLGKTSIYRLIGQDEFPRPIRLAERRTAWLASDIETWIKDRVQAERGAAC